MQYIYIGKLVNTHGIKGEVRILSSFKYKSDVFMPGNFLYLGDKHIKKEIKSYRKHKEFDMVCFNDINDINDVLPYKGQSVYFDRNEVLISGILNEDIIGLDVYDRGSFVGSVSSILQGKAYDILEIKNETKTFLVPNIDVFVKNIDLDKHIVEIESIEGLLYEN